MSAKQKSTSNKKSKIVKRATCFNFDDLRCDTKTFDSQVHRYDPTPCSPRWLSGYKTDTAQ